MMQKKYKTAKTDAEKTGKKNIFLFISILAVVAVSGCIVPGGDVFQGIFAPQRPATTEASADLITVQNTNIIPNPPVSASADLSNTNGFTVSFEVKNNDGKNEVRNVGVTNYDWGLCKQGKTPTGAGGGVVKSDIVQDTGGANVTTFTVTGPPGCGTGQPLVLADNTGLVSRTVCGQTANYEIKHLDGYTFDLCIGNSCLHYKYKDYATSGGGQTYNCAIGDKNSQCTQTLNGISYMVTEIRNTPTANCIGDSICTDNCPSYCDQQNIACRNNCNGQNKDGSAKYTGDQLTGCLKQCDNYALVPSAYQYAPCRPDYNPSFSGQCCKCVYSTTGFTQGGVSPPVAGAKTYQPLQTELFEYGFTAPTNDNIGNMPATCQLRYKITYTFIAKTQTDATVISQSKMEELQRAGQPPSVSPSQSVGVGPIKVFFDFGASQPVKSDDVIPVFITVEDRGSGLLDTGNGNIPSGKLKITVPPEFKPVAGGCDKFTGSGAILQNVADIPMIKKKSPQLRCSFKAPSVTDMKTFYITAELQYDYKFDNQINVAVNPTLVR